MEKDLRSSKLQKHRALFFFSLIAMVGYIFWRTFFTLPTKQGVVALLFGVALLVAEMGASFEAIVNYSMLSKYTPPEMPEIPLDWYPDIDICIATHNEPVELLYNTINGCVFLDYPDKARVHIHLCDDTARPEMEALAKRFGIHYWGLANNKDAKGGNLNNALRQTSAPIVVTLDADMIPRHEFLMKTVPYFFLPKMKKDGDGRWLPREAHEIDPREKVGFVQTPQGFYNPDLFQYNLYSERRIPGEQDLFFREINVSRSAYNASLYVGSNALIAREALEDVDYIAVDTITEDILTGIRIQKLGYTTYATAEVLVQGQAPVSVKTLLNQRERWGRGCIDAFRQEPILFSGRMSLGQKMSYVNCWVFWWTYLRRAIYLLAPIITILFNINLVQSGVWTTLAFWLPYYLLFNRSLRVMSGDVWNQHWSNVADTILFPYLIGPILMEQLGRKQKKFKITEKKVSGIYAGATFQYALPHLVLLAGMILSLVNVIGKSISTGALYSPIIFYWLIIGVKNLLFAIFFMWGRNNYRLAARFYFTDPVQVYGEEREWSAVICDVSESGLAFTLDHPHYMPGDMPVLLTVAYRGQEIMLSGRVVHIAASGQRWKYSIRLDDMEDLTKRLYMAYVYDRPHSLPTKLDPALSLLDDFNLQLGKRMTPVFDSTRVQPRVHLEIPFTLEDGTQGVLVDFNYRYAGVQCERELAPGEVLRIHLIPGFSLRLEAFPASTKKGLYEVRGSNEYIENPGVPSLLSELARKTPREKAELGARAEILRMAEGRARLFQLDEANALSSPAP